jgi:hypothetical protein
MLLVVLSFLFLVLVEGVVDSEYVLRVKELLSIDHHVNHELWVGLMKELLSLLSYSMVMRDACSILHQHLSSTFLNLFENLNCLPHSLGVEVESNVDVDSCTSFVELCDSEGDEELIILDALLFS